MKRELLENVKVQPYTKNAVIDREGFLSAVLGASVGTSTGNPTEVILEVTITDCDTENGEFTEVGHDWFIGAKNGDESKSLSYQTIPYPACFQLYCSVDPAGDELYNIDIDLGGFKKFVKINATLTLRGGTTPNVPVSYALALGDKNVQPV